MATKSDFDEVLRKLGKSDDKNVGEPVFYLLLDGPLDKATDYLVTVNVKGKTYGLTRPHGGSYVDDSVIYFSLTNGHQVDFVDGAKKQSDVEAACDLSDYSGTATVTLYKTDAQTEGTYPTGLEQIKQETVQISNGS